MGEVDPLEEAELVAGLALKKGNLLEAARRYSYHKAMLCSLVRASYADLADTHSIARELVGRRLLVKLFYPATAFSVAILLSIIVIKLQFFTLSKWIGVFAFAHTFTHLISLLFSDDAILKWVFKIKRVNPHYPDLKASLKSGKSTNHILTAIIDLIAILILILGVE